jgi:hypothetical protein
LFKIAKHGSEKSESNLAQGIVSVCIWGLCQMAFWVIFAQNAIVLSVYAYY